MPDSARAEVKFLSVFVKELDQLSSDSGDSSREEHSETLGDFRFVDIVAGLKYRSQVTGLSKSNICELAVSSTFKH